MLISIYFTRTLNRNTITMQNLPHNYYGYHTVLEYRLKLRLHFYSTLSLYQI